MSWRFLFKIQDSLAQQVQRGPPKVWTIPSGGPGLWHHPLVIVCDGSKEADARIARVLWNDPASGVMRHADAGYTDAIQCAAENGLDLPMINSSEG